MCTLEFKKLALQAVAPGARFPHRANRNRMTNQAIGTVLILIVAGEKPSGRYVKCFVSGGYLHRQASVEPRQKKVRYTVFASPTVDRSIKVDQNRAGRWKKKKKKKEVYTRPLPLTSCQEDRLGLDYTVLCHG